MSITITSWTLILKKPSTNLQSKKPNCITRMIIKVLKSPYLWKNSSLKRKKRGKRSLNLGTATLRHFKSSSSKSWIIIRMSSGSASPIRINKLNSSNRRAIRCSFLVSNGKRLEPT